MPCPDRHQSRTSSPELLDSGHAPARAASASRRRGATASGQNAGPARRRFPAPPGSRAPTAHRVRPACHVGAGRAALRRARAGSPPACARPIHPRAAPGRSRASGTVEPVDHQIRQLFGQLHLHVDPRIHRLEIGQRGAQPLPTEAKRGRQTDRARWLRLPLAQFGLGRREPSQQFPGTFTQGFAVGGRADAPRGALEQPGTQAGFQRGQAFGDHGRRQPQRARRRDQAAVALHREHELQIGTVQFFPLWKQSMDELLL